MIRWFNSKKMCKEKFATIDVHPQEVKNEPTIVNLSL